ncbi:MAG: beta-lactamase [Bacteroidetes bacterium]|jgi:CubicO group peptidase (beta-lactamase class C family)|nr:beta-lactamase [Bacteroidota bacterium]
MKKTLLILSIFTASFAVKAQTTDQQRVNKIDSLFEVYAKKNMFCGAVSISKKGTSLLSKGYGMANYSFDIPNTVHTKFKLASVSKQFTAMAIMILQEQGKLNTDDKLIKFIADYPNGEKITVHHLLTHTSGIHNFTSNENYDSMMVLPHTLTEIISHFKNQKLDFEPGEKFNYSNSGYVLLSYIIEKASGKTYGEFITTQIFEPLGMKNSGAFEGNKLIKNLALGYTNGENGLENAGYIDMSIPAGAGALYSTVEDLQLWDSSFYTEKLVKKATLDKMMTPFKEGYAYGLMIDSYLKHPWINHTGGIQGFSTVINRFPEDELCIVILKNVDNYMAFSANKVCRAIMFDDKYELPVERVAAKIDKAVGQSLCGDYELDPGFVMTVTFEGERMFVQATGQPKIEIFSEGSYNYFCKAVNAQFEFSKDKKNNISSLTLVQNGQKMPGKKIK